MNCIVNDVINTLFNINPGPGQNDQSQSRLKSLFQSVNNENQILECVLISTNASPPRLRNPTF